VKRQIKLSSEILEVIETMDLVFKTEKINYFIIGAMARDILLKQVFKIDENSLVTQDVDFGISIADWENYSEIEKILCENDFSKDAKLKQRFIFKNGFPIDIIPFGKIAIENTIIWQPDNSKTMSVAGYEEAFKTAMEFSVKDSIVKIKIASLVGLVILKLISWSERYPERKKDAYDLRIILKNYISANNSERLYAEDSDLMKKKDFDYDLSGARLLGRDIGKICNKATLVKIKEILEIEMEGQFQDRLALSMDSISRFSESHLIANQKMIKNLYMGIIDIINNKL
jgi:predicted nucleotidyltransferase